MTCAAGAAPAVGPDPESYLRYDGAARGADGSLLYREQHLLRLRDGALTARVVVYSCPDGRPFARKLLRYDASPLVPDLQFEDRRSGVRQSLRNQNGRLSLEARDVHHGRPVSANLAAETGLVADAGFDEFIRRSWDALVAGQPVAFRLLLLTDGSVVNLRATRVGSELLSGEPVERFRVSLSGLLGLIAPDIEVYYAVRDHVLRRFSGVTNLRDEGGKPVRATIDFPAAWRTSTTDAAWSAALSGELVAHCAGQP